MLYLRNAVWPLHGYGTTSNLDVALICLPCEMKRIIWYIICVEHCSGVYNKIVPKKHLFYVWHIRKWCDSETVRLFLYWGKFAVLNSFLLYLHLIDQFRIHEIVIVPFGTAHEMHDFWTKQNHVNAIWKELHFIHWLWMKENVPVRDSNSFCTESQP